jgi:hypothetical protein
MPITCCLPLMRERHLGLQSRIGVVAPKLLAKDFEGEISSAMRRRDAPYSKVVFHQFREINDVLPAVGKQMITACYKINVRGHKLLRDSYYFLNFGVRTTRHDYDSLLGLQRQRQLRQAAQFGMFFGIRRVGVEETHRRSMSCDEKDSGRNFSIASYEFVV